MHRIKFSETEIVETPDYREYFSRPCELGTGVAEVLGLPWRVIVAYRSGAVAEAWVSGAVAQARASGAVAEARVSGAVAIRPDGTWDGDVADSIPAVPRLYSQILEAVGREGCWLGMGQWHTCETDHCIAGWTTHLAGPRGLEMETAYGSTAAAAILIHMRSCPGVPIPDYYCGYEKGMEQLRVLAAAAAVGSVNAT